MHNIKQLREIKRCSWPENSTELMLSYHDKEWGVPSHDDDHLFEVLILDGAQAGLSWNTILNKSRRISYATGLLRPMKPKQKASAPITLSSAF